MILFRFPPASIANISTSAIWWFSTLGRVKPLWGTQELARLVEVLVCRPPGACVANQLHPQQVVQPVNQGYCHRLP